MGVHRFFQQSDYASEFPKQFPLFFSLLVFFDFKKDVFSDYLAAEQEVTFCSFFPPPILLLLLRHESWSFLRLLLTSFLSFLQGFGF